jgi:hypothetical protein
MEPLRISSPWVRSLAYALTCGIVAVLSARYAGAGRDPEPPKLLTAQEFRLVDKTGAVRAVMALQPDGSPYISLNDTKDNRRVTLRVRPEGGSAVAMNDADGKNRILLDTEGDGSASITLSSRKSKGGAGFLTPAEGDPIVVVRDKNGEVAFAEPQPQPAEPDEIGGEKQNKKKPGGKN